MTENGRSEPLPVSDFKKASSVRVYAIVGPRSFPGNPYDGHTLHAQLEQTAILLPGSPRPHTAIVDLGYRGVDGEVAPVKEIHRGRIETMNRRQRRMLKRRQASSLSSVMSRRIAACAGTG
ncbi:hypothetical protein CNECB9_500023 [Cupriavidus necator]|uniref:Transposase n=1 Tax=Cupriavidus necator TaxID=106590 RepID=A0A1K0JLW0_CUPNE|nr:hypothetical protein CNECB9_500023 [Cupriavidus necator]